MVAAGDREGRIRGERGARLVDAPCAGEDETGKDQRLRLGPALGKPLLDQELIGAPLRRDPAPLRA